MKKRATKTEFTATDARCIHITIEAVFDVREIGEMNDVLEQLQQYGAAKVTAKRFIAESFDAASRILDQKAIE